MSSFAASVSQSAPPTLRADRVAFRVGDRSLLDNVSVYVRAGEVVGLLGPNGSGKSTLLRLLARLGEPSDGTITLNGTPVGALDRRETARTIGYLPQSARSEWPLSVRETVTLGRTPFLSHLSRRSAVDDAAVARAMALTDTDGLAERSVNTLSGGERMRVMLARVLAGEPSLLLLDEPVTGLDPRHQLEAMLLLEHLTEEGSGTLVVLHDLTLAARFCHRVYVLHQGRVMAEGPPPSALDQTTIATAFEVEARTVGSGADTVIVPWTIRAQASRSPMGGGGDA